MQYSDHGSSNESNNGAKSESDGGVLSILVLIEELVVSGLEEDCVRVLVLEGNN